MKPNNEPFDINERIGDWPVTAKIFASAVPAMTTVGFLSAWKFTHSHIFGMGLLFMVGGAFVVFCNVDSRIRIVFILLPFVGILIAWRSDSNPLFLRYPWRHFVFSGIYR